MAGTRSKYIIVVQIIIVYRRDPQRQRQGAIGRVRHYFMWLIKIFHHENMMRVQLYKKIHLFLSLSITYAICLVHESTLQQIVDSLFFVLCSNNLNKYPYARIAQDGHWTLDEDLILSFPSLSDCSTLRQNFGPRTGRVLYFHMSKCPSLYFHMSLKQARMSRMNIECGQF